MMERKVRAVEVSGVTKTFSNGFEAIAGISFGADRGEVYGLLGLNGAGKTSVIKMLATLLRPTSGGIRIFGMSTTKQPTEIKRRIGVVPQENNLDTRLDVQQNLVFHCRYAGLAKKDYVPRVEEWLALLGLERHATEPVLRLSGGTRRKVMLAKAFLTRPEMLILDEPTAGLDPEVRALFWDKVGEFRRNGGAVLLSTHYLEEAEQLCDRIGILHGGRLVAEGALDELTRCAAPDASERNGLDAAFRRAIGISP
jgi:ABC-type multidrug transport system ATPase subunit